MGLSRDNDPAATLQDLAAILVRLSSDDAHAPTNDSGRRVANHHCPPPELVTTHASPSIQRQVACA
jgi:hypothetical protein